MPARGKRKPSRLAQRRVPKSRRKRSFFKLFWVVLGVSLVFVASLFLRRGLWSGESRLSLVIAGNRGDVTLAVFDPESGTITTIDIPGETEVNVARQLGTWRLASVLKLGENEGFGGRLLSETITKSLKLPVEAWASSDARGFIESDLRGMLKAMFSIYKTNLTLGDRINLGLFALRAKKTNRATLDLVSSGNLVRAKLADGTFGYKLRDDTFSSRVLSVFADNVISKSNLTVAIEDKTGRPGTAARVGEIIEVLGGKVVAIKTAGKDNFDCEITGKDKDSIDKIAATFSCAKKRVSSEINFDLEIKIGESFAKRF